MWALYYTSTSMGRAVSGLTKVGFKIFGYIALPVLLLASNIESNIEFEYYLNIKAEI